MIIFTRVYITQGEGLEAANVDCFERAEDGKIVDYVDMFGETIATYSPSLVVTVRDRQEFRTLKEAIEELL